MRAERESGERRDYLLYKLADRCLGGPTARTCKRGVCVCVDEPDGY